MNPMEQEVSPDQVAKTVFWTIMFFAAGFVIAVFILIR
jgi:hypothetical protein